MPVSLYQGTRVAIAELITEASINAVTEPPSEKSNSSLLKSMEIPSQIPLPTDLTETQKDKFLALLSHILVKDDDNLGHTNVMKHQTETGVAKPISKQTRWVPVRKCINCCMTC